MHGKTFQFMPILDKDLSLADPHPTLFRNVQCRNNSVESAKSGDPFKFRPILQSVWYFGHLFFVQILVIFCLKNALQILGYICTTWPNVYSKSKGA